MQKEKEMKVRGSGKEGGIGKQEIEKGKEKERISISFYWKMFAPHRRFFI